MENDFMESLLKKVGHHKVWKRLGFVEGRMRRSEITPELIRLSELAKALGFPQSVFDGDYFAALSTKEGYNNTRAEIYKEPRIFMAHNMDGGRYYTYASTEECGSVFSENPFETCVPDDWFLILSFSRCLEWLEEQHHPKVLGLTLEANNFIHGHWILSIKTKSHRGENIHEAIAKAVLKRLENNA